MAIPDNVSELPWRRDTAKKRCCLEERHGFALLGQANCQRHAKDSAADDCPPLAALPLDGA